MVPQSNDVSSMTTTDGLAFRNQKGTAKTTLTSILSKLDRLLKVIQKLQDGGKDALIKVMGGGGNGPKAQMARKLCDLWATRSATTASPDYKDEVDAIDSFCREMSTNRTDSTETALSSTEEAVESSTMKQKGNRALKGRRTLDDGGGFVVVGRNGSLEPVSEGSVRNNDTQGRRVWAGWQERDAVLLHGRVL